MDVQERGEGFRGIVGADIGRSVGVVGVDVEACEERLVEQASGCLVGDAVQVVRVAQEVQHGRERCASLVEVGVFAAGELGFEAGALVTDGA
ncbi:hypothetical protein OIE66_01020 [Nonomuraea sp. NBC_01738]|uniref:hypothetical protein n=1 Tax=Nonomuraea sp. NBC_01738 TaxID=2976003 RepID=UPI002E0F5353|nr:hypothetical protein OIE66_01020 [Nonomuraea sp. NBC_01738]